MRPGKTPPGVMPKFHQLLASARLLLFYKEHNPEFKDRAHQIISVHFSRFFKMKDFRTWLEKKRNEETLEFVMHAVEQNYSTVV